MKEILAILKDLGIEVPEGKSEELTKAVNENYKTINDWQKQHDAKEELSKQLNETKEALKKFDGVDAESLKKEIEALNETIKKNEADYTSKIAERDLHDLVNSVILSNKGKDADMIIKLLDMASIKESKNQKEDIEKAVKALAESEVTKGMFGEPEPEKKGSGNFPGEVKKGTEGQEVTMGSALAEYYK